MANVLSASPGPAQNVPVHSVVPAPAGPGSTCDVDGGGIQFEERQAVEDGGRLMTEQRLGVGDRSERLQVQDCALLLRERPPGLGADVHPATHADQPAVVDGSRQRARVTASTPVLSGQQKFGRRNLQVRRHGTTFQA
ncbi:hypothetical protein [Naasia sp. SYSU D00057]|uniref:hypothetical protein n=1 Tax=Naasia sp. SYSU D00057 TaxID=2817380 RepID=UPI001B302FA5|nr:hypothetical protein [Naasia sp. SYSU D00057]